MMVGVWATKGSGWERRERKEKRKQKKQEREEDSFSNIPGGLRRRGKKWKGSDERERGKKGDASKV